MSKDPFLERWQYVIGLAVGLIGAAAVVLAAVLAVGRPSAAPSPTSIVQPTSALPDTSSDDGGTATTGVDPMVCDDDSSDVLLQGNLAVKFSDDEKSTFNETIMAKPGDLVTVQMWVFNRTVGVDLLDPRVQFHLDSQSGSSLTVEGRMCSSNAAPFNVAATIVGDEGPIQASFVPGSVRVGAVIEGEYRFRPGSDFAFKSATGESVGRLPASNDPTFAHLVVGVRLQIDAA